MFILIVSETIFNLVLIVFFVLVCNWCNLVSAKCILRCIEQQTPICMLILQDFVLYSKRKASRSWNHFITPLKSSTCRKQHHSTWLSVMTASFKDIYGSIYENISINMISVFSIRFTWFCYIVVMQQSLDLMAPIRSLPVLLQNSWYV